MVSAAHYQTPVVFHWTSLDEILYQLWVYEQIPNTYINSDLVEITSTGFLHFLTINKIVQAYGLYLSSIRRNLIGMLIYFKWFTRRF